MDEQQAKFWLSDIMHVSRETLDRLDAFCGLLREENSRQNLVSSGSLNAIWSRHIADSAQLVRFCADGPILDLGSGAGLPGLVIALLRPQTNVTLVESRRLRFEWLYKAAAALDLHNVTVTPLSIERVETFRAATITARAFAPLPRLFALAHRFAAAETVWVLPKGRSAAEELASVRDTWHCEAEMHPSVTDPEATIIVAHRVRPARGGGR